MKINKKTITLFTIGLALALPISVYAMNNMSNAIEKKSFGKTPDGKAVEIYTLKNSNGLEARIMTYGGIVVSLKTPDKNGNLGDIVLGYDDLDGYIKNNPYFGSLVGRYGNRIAKGKFILDGKTYTLAVNNGENHLHGGLKGFDKVVWNAKPLKSADGQALELTYLSKDGEEGYPGNLNVKVIYTLTKKNELRIKYSAKTDKKTIFNPTHHSYFNLAGTGDILFHQLMINANKFTPVDKGLITTGELREVKGSPMDFTKPMAIGSRINAQDEQLLFGKGYDHNWVLNPSRHAEKLAAKVTEPNTGRVMEVSTTEPGIQFYSGNFLDGTNIGKGNQIYAFRNGFCLEAQHYPDSPNKKSFPSVVLNPGQEYKQTTTYKFSVQK